MKTGSTIDNPKAVTWEHVIDFERELSPTAARALLHVRFASREQERMSALLEKARSGKLTAAEEQQLDTYEQLGCLLGILQSKARRVLKNRAGLV